MSKKVAPRFQPKKDVKFDSDASSSEEEVEETVFVEEKVPARSGELQIKRMTLHKQILHRPDTYIGSLRRIKTSDRIWVKEGEKFKCRQATFPEGLLRLFMEAACNAIDNIWRSKQFGVNAKLIKFNIDRNEGRFTVWNDGKPISLDKFQEEDGTLTDEYKPEVIFGHLLTSTNYDDTEQRKTSGKNGYGIKLCSIFSTEFEVNLFNPEFGVYTQKWKNNMFEKGKPILSKNKLHYPKTEGKTGYTQVSWKPDYARFGMDGLDNEFMAVVEKSIYDYALIAKLNGVSVKYNDELVDITDLKSYANMYFENEPEEMIQLKSKDCTVVLAPRADAQSKSKLLHISFVNGILTPDGGVHVDSWEEAVFRPIINKINKVNPEKTEKKKDKKETKKPKKESKKQAFTVNIDHIRQHFTVFIVAEADKPDFKGQNKTYFNGPNVEVCVKKTDITKLCKWSFMDRIQDTIKLSELSQLKDVGKKKRNYVRIENLDDANNAGDPRLGRDCILCLTEDSLVNMGSTSVRIGKLMDMVGKRVMSWDKNSNGMVPSPIKNFFDQGTKECVRLTLQDGTSLQCTPDHKILASVDGNPSWIEAQNLTENQKVYVSLTTPEDEMELSDWKLHLGPLSFGMDTIHEYLRSCAFSRLLGYILTDGSLRSREEWGYHRTTVFAGHPIDVQTIVDDIELITGQVCSSTYSSSEQWGSCWTIELPKVLCQAISSIPDVIKGKRVCQEENLPGFIVDVKCPLPIIREFIGGLFGGDGWAPVADTSQSSCCVISAALSRTKKESVFESLRLWMKQIQALLGLFEIRTSVRTARQRTNEDNPSYELSMHIELNSLVAFQERVGFRYCTHKAIRLAGACSYLKWKNCVLKENCHRVEKAITYSETMTVPLACARSDDEHLSCSSAKYSKVPLRPNSVYSIRQKGKDTQSRRLFTDQFVSFDSYLEDIGLKDRFISQDNPGIAYGTKINESCVPTYTMRVLCVEKIGVKQVYDIEVDRTHSFQANGVVVHNCLTEGDSAATYVVNGMKYGIEGKKGHDWIGVMPLRGKILNVRNASNTTIIKNKEVKSIVQALGLEYGTDYSILSNRNKLRYGKLYVIADGDFDGLHIIGLACNMIDTLYPSLLASGDFFHFLRIPIVKINWKQEKMSFLFYYESQKWIEENKAPKKAIRYFKGLGTSNKQDIKEDFGRYPVTLLHDEEGSDLLRLVFHKDETDFRKDWLLNYTPQVKVRSTDDYKLEEVKIKDFLNEEMILFSIDDCKRSIPSILDGLKESHRKALYAAFKRNMSYKKKSVKVAQFAGYVSEHTGYHHGEQNLYETITKLGQRFAGSNNIPLFYADGQFGSRTGGGPKNTPGKDAAKARYIHTKLDMLTRLIFRPEDDKYLSYNVDEGDMVEPESYYPIVPMLLVNGSSGIGTGSSCNVPMYNVVDLIEWIMIWLDKKGQVKDKAGDVVFWETPSLVPYWRNFRGKVEVSGSKITTYGILEEVNSTTYRISEIPIGRNNLSIKKFKGILEEMRENKQIKRIKNESTDDSPCFTITTDEDGLNPSIKNLKLVDTLTTSNMVLFDAEGKLRKFDSVEEVMCYFCEHRLAKYRVRKQGQLAELREELKCVQNKIRFIRMVDSGELDIKDKEEDELESEMESLEFYRKPKKGKKVKSASQEEEDDVDDVKDEIADDGPAITSYDYLLDMKVRSLNVRSKVYKGLLNDEESLKDKVSSLESITEEDLWKKELSELKAAYPKWEKVADSGDSDESKKKGRKVPAGFKTS